MAEVAAGPTAKLGAAAVAVAAGILAFHLLLAGRTTLWDRDEPRFARAAVLMERSGQYLYPVFRDEVRTQKPILIYLLMTLSIRAIGVSEISVRLWAPIGLTAAALATFLIGRRLISARAGLLAMTIVAFNPLALVEGTLATTDAVLMAMMAAALAAFGWRLSSHARLGPWTIFAAACAGAFLVKGPVGVLPIVAAAGTLWSRRDRPDARRDAIYLALAALAALAIFLLWWVPANAATGGRFFSEGVRHDIIGRVLAPLEGHGGNPLLWLPFYPIVVLLGFAPWSAYIAAVCRQLRRGPAIARGVRPLLTWWIACPLVAFSAAATHLPHYILPIWPPLALATAATIDSALERGLDDATRRWISRGLAVTVVTGLLACAAIVLASTLPSRDLLWRALPALAAVAGGAAAMIVCHLASRYRQAYAAALASVVAFESAIALVWVPAIDAFKPVPRLARTIHEAVPTGRPIATFRFDEPSLDFYLDATPRRFLDGADLSQWAQATGDGVVVTTRAAARALGPLPLREIGSASGYDIATGRPVELVAFARRQP